MDTLKQKLLIVSLIIFVTSCSTTPHVTFKEYTPSGGKILEQKVALIISDEFKNKVYYGTVYGSCVVFIERGRYQYRKRGVIQTRNTVGVASEKLFVKGLYPLFNKVDTYRSIAEVRNKDDYDYILVPDSKISTSYDKKGSIWQLAALVEYQLYVRDAKTDAVVVTFAGSGSGAINWLDNAGEAYGRGYETYCAEGLSYNSDMSKGYQSPMGKAMGIAFENLLRATEIGLIPIIQAKAQERALPSSLSLSIRFSDDSSFLPNKILDAGEEAQIFVMVKNDGQGASYGTVLKVTSENPRVTADKEIPLGDTPRGTKEVKVNVKAGLDIQDGTIPFIITCSEKRGYDSKKYTLNVQAAHYEKPELVITGYKINDSSTGLGQGNGNGIPENGETIEVIPLVKNTGTGTACKVDLSLQSLSSSLEVKHGSSTIPQILGGQVGTVNLAFAIPTTYSGRSVEFSLAATDIRGESGTTKQFALATEINQPFLAYTYRVIDQKGNNRNDIQNGEYGEIEIRPANKGKMEARNVSIDLASDAVSFSKAHDEILRIGPQAEYAPIRFSFQVPRVIDKKFADFTVKLSQKDFPGISDTVNIPIRLVLPEFRVIHQLLSQNRSGSIEQGEGGNSSFRWRISDSSMQIMSSLLWEFQTKEFYLTYLRK